MTPPLTVTEDTPADMLAGSMDLDIVLPSGHVVRTSVQRSMPMMDLLVQITTAHRLSPGSHSLQAMGERGALPYKPSTPIGALDTFTVRITQKRSNIIKKAPQVPTVLPMSFRLQVHLPRSQLFVMRVTSAVTLSQVLRSIADEKNLDTAKYELRKTGNMSQALKQEQTMGELDTQELTLVVKGSDPVRQLSSADIMHVKQANNRYSACDSSLSSGSLDSRSISPVVAPPSHVPQPPQRKKRRPAPKPPEAQTRISHSRESSDSSGYHEPSTLSESPTHGGPPSETSSMTSRAYMTPRNSNSLSNLTSIPANRLTNSPSVTSLSSNGGKKKRAPPPPSQPAAAVNGEKPKSATLPADARRVAAAAGPLPPAPVALAPSPPTSPVAPPIPKPRTSKTRSQDDVMKNPSSKIQKQTAVDLDSPMYEQSVALSSSVSKKSGNEKSADGTERRRKSGNIESALFDLNKSMDSLRERMKALDGKNKEGSGPTTLSSMDSLRERMKAITENETATSTSTPEKLKDVAVSPEESVEANELRESTETTNDQKSGSEGKKHLRETKSSNTLLRKRIIPTIQKTQIPVFSGESDLELYSSISHGGEISRINVADPLNSSEKSDFESDEDVDANHSNKKTHLKEVKSTPIITGILEKPIVKTRSDVSKNAIEEEFNKISRWDEVADLSEIGGELTVGGARFSFGSSSTIGRKDSVAECEENEMHDGDGFIEETQSFKEPMTTSSDGRTTDGDSQPESLTVDWEYQLPPPPTHFRDLEPPVSPTPTGVTDMATLGTVDTLNTYIGDNNAALRTLNGIHEEAETELPQADKISVDETDRTDRQVNELVSVENGFDKEGPDVNGHSVGYEGTNGLKGQVSSGNDIEIVKSTKNSNNVHISDVQRKGTSYKSIHMSDSEKNEQILDKEKVLIHKSEVMNELTNVLENARNRLPEKSQSYNNLYFPSGTFESKKKANTLSHSQSFLNPPISNFKISNYETRPKAVDDQEFKRPAAPVKLNGVRRSDSVNMKKVNVDNIELLQQQFLQFLHEKQLQNSGVELEDLNVVPVLHSPSKRERMETVDERVPPVVINEVKKTVNAYSELPAKLSQRMPNYDFENDSEDKEESNFESKKIDDIPDLSAQAEAIIVTPNDRNTNRISNKLSESGESSRLSQESKSETSTKEPLRKVIEVRNVETRQEPIKRSFFQPPTVSMGTWGERPKSKVLIKDEDYITQAEIIEKRRLFEKSASVPVTVNKKPPPQPEPKEVPKSPEKKTVISIKKPTNYELFSALSKRKDLEMEDERLDNRLPKVCAVELKKQFRAEPDLLQGLEIEKTVQKVEEAPKYVPKTTSVYLNGAPKPWNVDAQNATKSRLGLMPVVKGFRSTTHVDVVPEPIAKQQSYPELKNKFDEPIQRQQSLPTKISEPIKSRGIPTPPPIGAITLKPVGARQIKPKTCEDPRDQLLEQIRRFGGSDRLRKTVQ